MQQRESRGSFGSCSGCGKRIVWIKTTAGKNMPCDPVLVNYTVGGKDRIVTPQGTVVAGTIVDSAEKGRRHRLYITFRHLPAQRTI